MRDFIGLLVHTSWHSFSSYNAPSKHDEISSASRNEVHCVNSGLLACRVRKFVLAAPGLHLEEIRHRQF